MIAPILVLAIWTGGCGDTATTRRDASTSTTVVPTSFPGGNDRDDDDDRNDDDSHILDFGRAAGPSDLRESRKLVQSYFLAASAGDGAAGCKLLVPFVAERVSETVGSDPNASCASALTGYFERQLRLLRAKRATMSVVAVRIEGDRGLVVLSMPTLREVRQMPERRVDGHWRLLYLLDGIVE